jgi:molybdenum cofactor guanylyltransferase
MTPREPVTVIVLAGGRSSRFGRDKLAEPIGGRTILERSIDAIRPVAREILVVTAPEDARRVPDDAIAVRDPVSYEGPLIGLLTGLRHASHGRVLAVGGDMPTMVGAVLETMLARLRQPSIEAVVLEHGGRGRPLPLAIRRSTALKAAERLTASGERRLRALIELLVTAVIDEATWRELDPEGRTLRDVDTPADLA